MIEIPHAFIYSQTTGRLSVAVDGLASFTLGVGYSGAGIYKNKTEAEGRRSEGPIPRGQFTIGPPYHDEHRGWFTFTLSPSSDTNMLGRSGFLIHADSIAHPGTASQGCIILPDVVRYLIAVSTCRVLKVTA